jgi:hypothetical protein
MSKENRRLSFEQFEGRLKYKLSPRGESFMFDGRNKRGGWAEGKNYVLWDNKVPMGTDLVDTNREYNRDHFLGGSQISGGDILNFGKIDHHGRVPKKDIA